MRIVILTCNPKGVASRVLPVLCGREPIDIAGVVLAHGVSPNRKRNIRRKIEKTLKIGLFGALNGIRMRRWYADDGVEDIRSLCKSLNVELRETPSINCDTTKKLFREAKADLGLSLGNGYIPKGVFSIPTYGMINIHTEILPEFQGAQGVIWPIYEGRTETGFTIHQIDENIDTGDILFQKRIPIRFFPSLRDTVRHNVSTVRAMVPDAFVHVCENYLPLKEKAIPQGAGKSYTTPSLWEFLRMVKHNRAMYKEDPGKIAP